MVQGTNANSVSLYDIIFKAELTNCIKEEERVEVIPDFIVDRSVALLKDLLKSSSFVVHYSNDYGNHYRPQRTNRYARRAGPVKKRKFIFSRPVKFVSKTRRRPHKSKKLTTVSSYPIAKVVPTTCKWNRAKSHDNNHNKIHNYWLERKPQDDKYLNEEACERQTKHFSTTQRVANSTKKIKNYWLDQSNIVDDDLPEENEKEQRRREIKGTTPCDDEDTTESEDSSESNDLLDSETTVSASEDKISDDIMRLDAIRDEISYEESLKKTNLAFLEFLEWCAREKKIELLKEDEELKRKFSEINKMRLKLRDLQVKESELVKKWNTTQPLTVLELPQPGLNPQLRSIGGLQFSRMLQPQPIYPPTYIYPRIPFPNRPPLFPNQYGYPPGHFPQPRIPVRPAEQIGKPFYPRYMNHRVPIQDLPDIYRKGMPYGVQPGMLRRALGRPIPIV